MVDSSQTVEKVKKILKFWKLIEIITPTQPFSGKEAKVYQVSFCDGVVSPREDWLWQISQDRENKRGYSRKKEQSYFWVIEGGIIKAESVFRKLREKLGVGNISEDDYPNYNMNSKAKLFEIIVDSDGKPDPKSLKVSLFFWGAGNLLEFDIKTLVGGGKFNQSRLPHVPEEEWEKVSSFKYGYKNFNIMILFLQEWIYQNSDQVVDSKWLTDLTERICHACYFPVELVTSNSTFQIRCYRVAQNQAENQEKSDLINSFFVSSLTEIEEFLGNQPAGNYTRTPFWQYITAPMRREGKKSFIDLRTEDGLLNYSLPLLSPKNYPSGRWPSEYALVFSQQVAVNGIITDLMENKRFVFAVNGPPGTGKTTLLRDIIAAFVTERAKKLVELGENAFGSKQSIQLNKKEVSFYPLASELSGTAIVVASSNNGAVENITLELPRLASISQNARDYLSCKNWDYYADFAKEYLGMEEVWGFVSAPIGKKKNCDKLVEKFILRLIEEHLSKLIKSQSDPRFSFEKACELFRKALQAEERFRSFLLDKHSNYQKLQEIKRKIVQLEAERERLHNMIPFLRRERVHLETQIKAIQANKDYQSVYLSYQKKQRELEQWERNKPGWFSWLMSFGKAHKDWQRRYQALEEELGRLRTRLLSYEQRIEHLRHELANLDERRVRQELSWLEQELKKQHSWQAELEQEVRKSSDIYAYCPDLYLEENQRQERELLCPWAWPVWLQARERVFLTALMVHRAFVESHARQMWCNLELVAEWLQGKSLSRTARQTALDSLCLVIPVVSTTFASMPRLFGGQSPGCIGWLLIDEAGQALPQHAAVALWWAARAVVVGDPLQLEPVFQSCPLLETLLAADLNNLKESWYPSQVCAQTLADLSMDVGTVIPTETGKGLQVGVPLIVHRRCNEPMFSISNQIAYDGMMVYGKQASPVDMPQSFWVNVRVRPRKLSNGESHWIQEEGEQLELILTQLIEKECLNPEDIFLISPFRDVSLQLKQIAGKKGLDSKKVGTVHTAQGKEAAVVILVLGGHPSKPNAKSFAVARPNLLNVAVTRAKERLIVIGNAQQWANQRFFSKLAEYLPPQASHEVRSFTGQ